MDQLTKLFQALAALAWPAIAVAVVVIFRPAVAGIIESARSRKFTIKVGGQELTMDEAGEQQRNLIADLQTQLVEVRKRVEGFASLLHGASGASALSGSVPASQLSAAPAPAPTPALPPAPAAVLWVDDNPKNNSYFVELLSNLGIKVDLAVSTADGLSLLGRRRYRWIISDMGRYEGGAENSDAGIDLLKEVRRRDGQIPFFVFCSTRAAQQYGTEAIRLGATGVTSSPTELSGFLHLDEMKAAS